MPADGALTRSRRSALRRALGQGSAHLHARNFSPAQPICPYNFAQSRFAASVCRQRSREAAWLSGRCVCQADVRHQGIEPST